MKLSVAILTFNEEKNIRDCLESVKWADEIIVVDEKSTDKTVAIAKKYTDKVFLVDHDELFHQRKQLAIDKCTSDWVLQIDADERVTPELKAEILAAIKTTAFTGYEFPRKNIIFGKWITHTGWYPDCQTRLFRRGKGHLTTKSFHEQIKVDGNRGELTANLLHEHYQSVEQFITRLNRYTTNDAGYILSKGETVTWTDAIKYPVDEFLKRFFYWKGYKDGFHGLVLSLLQAFSRLVVFAKIWEKQKFWAYGGNDFRRDVIETVQKSAKDYRHWVIASEPNPLRKAMYKLRSKITG